GHAGSMGGMGMRGAPMSHSMGMRGGFMPNSMGRMPMQRGSMMNSPSGFERFGDRNFNRNDRFGRFNRFNDGRFARFDRFHRFNHFHHFNRNHFNNVVFIGDFGFPWWWGWGWAPWGGWGWGYPYGYYGGYNYGYYGSSYGYGNTSGSRGAELQSRLARGRLFYRGFDGNPGPSDSRGNKGLETGQRLVNLSWF